MKALSAQTVPGKTIPDKVAAGRPGASRTPLGLVTPGTSVLRAGDGDTAGQQPVVGELEPELASATPENEPFGAVSAGLANLPGETTSPPMWDPTPGATPLGAKPLGANPPMVPGTIMPTASEEGLDSSAQGTPATSLSRPPFAHPAVQAGSAEGGDGSGVEGADDAAESDTADTPAAKDPAFQSVPVDVALPATAPIPVALPKSTPDTSDTADSTHLPSTFGRALSTTRPTAVGSGTRELTLEPEAAVMLRIKTPPEAVATASAAKVPMESGPVTIRPGGPNATEVPPEGDAGHERSAEVPPPALNKGGEAEAILRIPPPVRAEMPRLGEDSSGDRKAGTRKPVTAAIETRAEVSNAEPGSSVPAAPTVAVRVPDSPATSHFRETAPPQAVPKEQLPPEPLPRAPLKSMSLEFSPDGAGDVHLKLSERAGEVHVSLHSSDSALNHQLRNGIGDLASVLAGAGYEADAWTSPDRGGRQQREQDRPQERQEQNAGSAFEMEMTQSPQEVI